MPSHFSRFPWCVAPRRPLFQTPLPFALLPFRSAFSFRSGRWLMVELGIEPHPRHHHDLACQAERRQFHRRKPCGPPLRRSRAAANISAQSASFAQLDRCSSDACSRDGSSWGAGAGAPATSSSECSSASSSCSSYLRGVQALSETGAPRRARAEGQLHQHHQRDPPQAETVRHLLLRRAHAVSIHSDMLDLLPLTPLDGVIGPNDDRAGDAPAASRSTPAVFCSLAAVTRRLDSISDDSSSSAAPRSVPLRVKLG